MPPLTMETTGEAVTTGKISGGEEARGKLPIVGPSAGALSGGSAPAAARRPTWKGVLVHARCFGKHHRDRRAGCRRGLGRPVPAEIPQIRRRVRRKLRKLPRLPLRGPAGGLKAPLGLPRPDPGPKAGPRPLRRGWGPVLPKGAALCDNITEAGGGACYDKAIQIKARRAN